MAPKDGGKTIQTLISSDRFREITSESLGNALRRASAYGCPDVVRAIMESERVHEISLEDFGEALRVAGDKVLSMFIIKKKRVETLRMLLNFPQSNKVGYKIVEKFDEVLCLKYRSTEYFIKA